VQTTFSFQAEKACLVAVIDGVQRFGCVHVTYRYIALFPEWMIRQVVLFQIIVDIPISPVCDRMYLPAIA
jgi:hypothetical protein